MSTTRLQQMLASACNATPAGPNTPEAAALENLILGIERRITNTIDQNHPHSPGPLRKIVIPREGKAPRIANAAPNEKEAKDARLYAKCIVAPILEAIAHPDTHGCRPGRGTATAIKAVIQAVEQVKQPTTIVQIDIKDAFAQMPAGVAIDKMPPETKRYLKETQQRYREHTGTRQGFPQGHPAGPAICNHAIDRALQEARQELSARLITYVDDITIIAPEPEIDRTTTDVTAILAAAGMKLNTDKTRRTKARPGTKIDILGYRVEWTIGRPTIRPKQAAYRSLRKRLEEATCLADRKAIFAGWLNAYHMTTDPRHLRRAMAIYYETAR